MLTSGHDKAAVCMHSSCDYLQKMTYVKDSSICKGEAPKTPHLPEELLEVDGF